MLHDLQFMFIGSYFTGLIFTVGIFHFNCRRGPSVITAILWPIFWIYLGIVLIKEQLK